MAIELECPNGHQLKVKDRYAGQTGLCPRCKARVRVPSPGDVTDDDILDILGPPPPAPEPEPEPEDEHPSTAAIASDDYVHQDPRHTDGSGISLLGSSIIRGQKICPACGRKASFTFKWCPSCGTPLGGDAGADARSAQV
jgi:hypothetical protein